MHPRRRSRRWRARASGAKPCWRRQPSGPSSWARLERLASTTGKISAPLTCTACRPRPSWPKCQASPHGPPPKWACSRARPPHCRHSVPWRRHRQQRRPIPRLPSSRLCNRFLASPPVRLASACPPRPRPCPSRLRPRSTKLPRLPCKRSRRLRPVSPLLHRPQPRRLWIKAARPLRRQTLSKLPRSCSFPLRSRHLRLLPSQLPLQHQQPCHPPPRQAQPCSRCPPHTMPRHPLLPRLFWWRRPSPPRRRRVTLSRQQLCCRPLRCRHQSRSGSSTR